MKVNVQKQDKKLQKKREKWTITEKRKEKESSLLVSLEAADSLRIRCDFSKLSCLEIADGVLCLLGWGWADQMTTDTANKLALP